MVDDGRMSYHDNVVVFSWMADVNIISGTFEIKTYSVTSGQDPNGEIYSGRKYTCGSDGKFSFRVGRKGSESVAAWFNANIPASSTTFNHTADKLNFAFIGTLTLTATAPAFEGTKTFTFPDIALAQGHAGLSNNWWFGGKYCFHSANHEVRCEKVTPEQLLRFEFHRGDSLGMDPNVVRFGITKTYHKWMRFIPDAARLDGIVMPATHNSGLSELHHCTYPVVGDGYVKTQNLSVSEQMWSGVRYFDIRVDYDHDELVTYHRNDDGIGCNGQSFHEVLEQVTSYLRHYPTETAIMAINDIRSDRGDQVNIKARINALTESYRNILFTAGDVNLAEVTLKDLRGKLVLIFHYDDNVSPIHGRFRYHGSASPQKNLSVYDRYTNTGNYANMESDQLNKLDENGGLGRGYLFALSWTLTVQEMGFPPPTTIYDLAQEANPRLGPILRQRHSQNLPKPNIVWLDYIDESLAEVIVRQNDLITDFTAPTMPPELKHSVEGDTHTFTWGYSKDDVGVAGYEHRLDDGEWVEDSAPGHTVSYTTEFGPEDHTFSVRAFDRAGNRSPSNMYTVYGPVCPPYALLYHGKTRYGSHKFSWSGPDSPRWHYFEAHVDNDDLKIINGTHEAWYDNLVPGRQSIFGIRAFNSSNKYSDLVELPFIVASESHPTVPPKLSLTLGLGREHIFRWTYSSDFAVTRYACKIDDQGWESIHGEEKRYFDLSFGDHVFSVRAVDATGHFSQAAAIPFTLELSEHISSPTNLQYRLDNNENHILSWDQPNDNSFTLHEIKLDGGEWSFVQGGARTQSFANLEAGNHVFSVRARHLLYGASEKSEIEFTSGVIPAPVNLQYSHFYNGYMLFWDYSQLAKGFEYRLDGDDAWTRTEDTQVLYASLSNDLHVFHVRAMGAGGGHSETVEIQFGGAGAADETLSLLKKLRELSNELDSLATELVERSKGFENTNETKGLMVRTDGQTLSRDKRTSV